MTTAQKIIKYIANAFAIFLIVTIIFSILSAGYGILIAIGVINKQENKISENLITISDNIDEISTLKLDIKASDLQIKNGKKFEVKTNNSNIKYSNENGKVSVKEEGMFKWHLGKNYEGTVIIYLPEDMEQIEEVKMDIGAGTIFIENLKTKNLYFELGAGTVTVDSMTVSKKMRLNGGAGNIEINSGKIANADVDLGVGKTTIKSDFTGNSKIDTGIGELNLDLTLPKEDYKINVNKGIGEIRFNGKSIEDDTSLGNGTNYIKVSGGVGGINIKTE